MLVAFAVIATASLNPFQSAIGVVCLVYPVLIEAGFHSRFAGGLT
jgi:hypothetical protein